MPELFDWIDAMSWWQVGALCLGMSVALIGVIVILDGLRNSRARYWGGM